MHPYFRRLIGAIALDVAAYEDVEADPNATAQACVTVVLSSVAAAYGLSRLLAAPVSMAWLATAALLAWASWALLTFEVGARLLPGARTHSDVGELLRTLGFAASPGLLFVLAAFPGLAAPIVPLVAVWMCVTMIVAVRQALDYTSTVRAIGVCLVGWLLTIAVALAGGILFGARLH